MSIIDDFKTTLSHTSPNAQLRIQLGDNGTIFQFPAYILMNPLGVRPAPRVRLKVTSNSLNIRDRPTTAGNIISRYIHDQIFDIDPTTSSQSDGYRWAMTYDGRGYVALDFTTPTTDDSAAADNGWTLPITAAQRGVGLSAGGYAPDASQQQILQRNGIEFALICAYQKDQAARTIPILRSLGVQNFILRACISEAITTPQRYADLSLPIIQEYVNALGSVENNQLLIALHNEPNIRQEGWGSAWRDGAGFDGWYKALFRIYRQRFPEAKLGFPALSPGGDVPDVRMNETTFLSGCQEAIAISDWVGVHYYWDKLDGADIVVPADRWRARFGTKYLIATEVGPTDRNRVQIGAVLKAYNAFRAANIPASGWVLSGAGAWQNAAWDVNGILFP